MIMSRKKRSQIIFSVDGIRCNHCEGSIKLALRKVAGVKQVEDLFLFTGLFKGIPEFLDCLWAIPLKTFIKYSLILNPEIEPFNTEWGQSFPVSPPFPNSQQIFNP